MKKNILIAILIVSMILCSSMTVFAADTWKGPYDDDSSNTGYQLGTTEKADVVTSDNNGGTKNVSGTYDLSDTQQDTYNVEIVWGALTYEMATSGSASGTWTVDESTGDGYYTITDFPGWVSTSQGTADKITVNNKSNVAITATLTGNISVTDTKYVVNSGTVEFTNVSGNNLNLASYEGASSVPTADSIVSISGAGLTKAPTLNNSTGLKLGTVTVTISKQGS